MMKCSIEACPGEYVEKEIVRTLEVDGMYLLIQHVPAEVCSVCGDTLLSLDTVKRMEEVVSERRSPVAQAPVFEFAELGPS